MPKDIEKILKRLINGKTALRKERAKLPFEKKIEMVKKLQEIAEGMREGRENEE